MSQPDQSKITLHPGGGATIEGPDAMNWMRAIMLQQGLKLYAKTKMKLTRSVSPTDMLKMATTYTQKPYKRGEYQKAADDMKIWCDTMRAALPTETSK